MEFRWQHSPTELELLAPFYIGVITRGDGDSGDQKVPKDKYLTGRVFIQRIERINRCSAPALNGWFVKRSAPRARLMFLRSHRSIYPEIDVLLISNITIPLWKNHYIN